MKSSRNLRRARLCSLLALGWLVSAAADRAFAADVVTPSDADKEKVMAQAPPGARQHYDGYWFSPPIIADPLANWQPHKPPWQFCHNNLSSAIPGGRSA